MGKDFLKKVLPQKTYAVSLHPSQKLSNKEKNKMQCKFNKNLHKYCCIILF